jgi:hypothetical protein
MLRLGALVWLAISLTACVTASDDRYVMPAEGRILPSRDQAEGIRIKTDGRAKVRATRTGRVLFAGKTTNGRMVVLDHGGGMRSRYHGLQRLAVAKGEWVRSGKPVGWVGKRTDDAAELSFALSLAQARIDPVQVIDVPDMRTMPKVKVSIEDERSELDVLVDTVATTNTGADKYGPRPTGSGLVLDEMRPAPKKDGSYPEGYDKYGPLPTSGLN